MEIDIKKGMIKTSRKELKFAPFPDFAVELINAGGLFNYIKK